MRALLQKLDVRARVLLPAILVTLVALGLMLRLVLLSQDRIASYEDIKNDHFAQTSVLTELSRDVSETHAAFFQLLFDAQDIDDESEIYRRGRPLQFKVQDLRAQVDAYVAMQIETRPDDINLGRLPDVMTGYVSSVGAALLDVTADVGRAQEKALQATAEFQELMTLFHADLNYAEQDLNQRWSAQTDLETRDTHNGILLMSIGALLMIGLSVALSHVMVRELNSLSRRLSDQLPVDHQGAVAEDGGTLDRLRSAVHRFSQQSRVLKDALRELERQKYALDKHAIVSITDVHGRIIYANDNFCKISGYARDELIGQDHRILNSSTHPKPFFEDLWHTIRAGEVWQGEIQNQAKSGRKYWVRSTITPFFDESGKPDFYIAIRTDITVQKESEERITRASNQFRDIVDQAGDGLFVLDLKTLRFVEVNRTAHDSLGYTRDELMALRIGDIGVTTGTEDLRRIGEGLKEGEHLTRTGAQLRKDGSHMPVEVRLSILNMDGQERMIIVARDITDRVAAEEKARQNETRFRDLFDQSPIATMEGDWSQVKLALDDLVANGVTDLRSYLADHPAETIRLRKLIKRKGLSAELFKLFGVDDAADFGRLIGADIDNGIDAVTGGEVIARFYEGRQRGAYEGSAHRKDGTKITTFMRFFRATEPVDDWSRVLVTIEDITERRETETRLRQTQRMEAVGKLTGGIAHDFNNLLAVIQGCAEFLSRSDDQDTQMVDNIIRAAERGSDLTHRLLAYSRQQPLRSGPIDVAELMANSHSVLSRTLGETIDIIHDDQDGLWLALADASQVEDALLNLAINARDAMPDGGQLTLGSSNVAVDQDTAHDAQVDPGDYVCMRVRDTGTGIAPEIMDKVFEPFFTTKDVGKGSGLGLSMVFGFAPQSGGFVQVESIDGQGTEIRVYLPRAIDNCEADAAQQQVQDKNMGNGGLILVLEDDPMVRELTVKTLASLGYKTLEAETAAEAQAVFDTGAQIDLLLSDVVLPGGMSGPDFANSIRQSLPDLKMIFMSGYSPDDVRDRGGMDLGGAILTKPFRRQQLADAIESVLSV